MEHKSHKVHPSVPRAVILLPVVVAMHIAEKWFAGFIDWARCSLGVVIPPERFLADTAAGKALFAFGAIVAFREPRLAWIGVSLTALVCLNAFVQAGLSLAVGVYSPGTVKGLLLYLPLSFVQFQSAAAHISRTTIIGAILLGFRIHAGCGCPALPY